MKLFRGITSNACNTLKRFPLTATVVTRMTIEDPLLFIIQALRKMPLNFRQLIAHLFPTNSSNPNIAALRSFVLDHRTRTKMTLTNANPKTLSRLGNELLVQLGCSPVNPTDIRTSIRSAWESGNIHRLSQLPFTEHQRVRYHGELTILQPNLGISLQNTTAHKPTHTINNQVRTLHILTNSLPWTRSGYTYRTQHLLKALSNENVKTLGVTRIAYPTVIGGLSANDVDVVDGVQYRRLFPNTWPPDPSMRLVKQAQMLMPIVERFQPNVLHATTNYLNALVTDAISRKTGIPWIYEMRGNMEQTWVARQPKELQNAARTSKRYWLMRAKETEMAMRCNHVVVLSNIQKQGLIERGVHKNKITVIPNAADPALLSVPRDPRGARQKLGIPVDAFWVGSVTSVVDYEGLPTLVEAVAYLSEQGVNVRCAIVGDGVALPDLKEHIRKLGLTDRVVTPGRLPHEEALLWCQALNVFAIPRLNTDVTRTVTPMKGLEAQALGIPLVISDLSALTEPSAPTTLTFPPNNSKALSNHLYTLAHSQQTLQTHEHAARTFAATKSWSTNAKTLRGLYERLDCS